MFQEDKPIFDENLIDPKCRYPLNDEECASVFPDLPYYENGSCVENISCPHDQEMNEEQICVCKDKSLHIENNTCVMCIAPWKTENNGLTCACGYIDVATEKRRYFKKTLNAGCRFPESTAECKLLFPVDRPFYDALSTEQDKCRYPSIADECALVDPNRPFIHYGNCEGARSIEECRKVNPAKPWPDMEVAAEHKCRAPRNEEECAALDPATPDWDPKAAKCVAEGLSAGAVGGIVVAVIVGLLIVVGAVGGFVVYKK